MMIEGEKIIASSRPELLSPAGDWDCLWAAVVNGADAVYLGTREFNARVYARNFSIEELGEVVKCCHIKGVRVYLTMNTLVKNHEVRRFFNVISQAYSLGIDGVIIQHISFLKIIKDSFPGLSVFISTQAAIGNTSAASLLKAADKVILPRELKLEEVKKFVDSGVRTEIFVHGALCFSYSGLCLFSSFVGNRSGNRGSCAQLCRQKYNGSYLLSIRELRLVQRVPELIQAGITGFKIEGRMRSRLYVAVATRLYRKAIDSFLSGNFILPQKEMAEIEVVFNREFTEGFMFGDKALISPEKPMNRGALLGTIEDGQILLQRPLSVGDGVGIWENNIVSGAIIKEIILNGKRVSSAEAGDRVDLELHAKDGSRIYLTSSPQININPDLIVNRPAITQQVRGRPKVSLPAVIQGKAPTLKLLVKVYSLEEAKESMRAGADTVFYDIFSPDFPEAGEFKASPFGAYLPRIMDDEKLSQGLVLLKQRKPGAILAGNLGFLSRRDEFAVPVYLDYALNSFNDLDLLFFQKYNVTPILSPELSLKEMVELKNKQAVVFCHGDIVLVNTLVEIKDKKLVDEKGLIFPVRQEDSYWQILNSRPFGLFNDIQKLRAAGFSLFFIDKAGKGAYFTALYHNVLKDNIADRRHRKGYTAGHLYRPVL